MAEVLGDAGNGLPEPESDDLGRYLEDTITIDWQAPEIMTLCSDLLAGQETQEARVTVLFDYVRDEITHSIDVSAEIATCSASQVLNEGTGLCYSKSHLLAALLRVAGYPTGFCYARLVNSAGQPDSSDRMTLHGFNAVWWKPAESWVFLDARGNREGLSTEARFESPWSLAYAPNPDLDEAFLPFIYRRPGKRVIDLLERAPGFAAVCRNLPDSL